VTILLPQAGSAELLDDVEIEAVHPHAEMESSLQQGGEEPVGWVTAVEHAGGRCGGVCRGVRRASGARRRRGIELGGQGHFDPGQIEREAFGLDLVARRALAVTGLAEQGQVQVRGIAGDDAQPVPERKAELRIDQGEEMIVEKREGGGRHLLPGFGKGLRGDFSCRSARFARLAKKASSSDCTLDVYPPSRQAIRRGKLRMPVREKAFSVKRD
jgi:hypothetical protein